MTPLGFEHCVFLVVISLWIVWCEVMLLLMRTTEPVYTLRGTHEHAHETTIVNRASVLI